MGRGRSGRTSSPQPRTQRQQRPQQQSQEQQQPRQPRTPGELYDFFKTANDQQATDMLNTWKRERMDNDGRSNDTDVQRFMHYVGWSSNEPEVLDENSYQAAWRAAGRPQQLYHSDKAMGGVSAKEFANQFMGRGYDFAGNKYRHYVSNGYVGGGTYFATSAADSKFYGTNQFRGYLNNNARVISISDLQRQYNEYASAHPAFARMMNRVRVGYGGEREKLSIFAAMRGYNVIRRGDGYHAVLDRSAITVSEKQRSTRGLRSNW